MRVASMYMQLPVDAVLAELRGRYPKHAWPTDPRRATPLQGVRR